MSYHSPSEASKLLEAALQQMDGIIQGAKYELPSTSTQDNQNENFVLSSKSDSHEVTSPPPPRPSSSSQNRNHNKTKGGNSSNSSSAGIGDALERLRMAIVHSMKLEAQTQANAANGNNGNGGGLPGLHQSFNHFQDEIDNHTLKFIADWIRSRRSNPDEDDNGFNLEERLFLAESDREDLRERLTGLYDQTERQRTRIQELEQVLDAKKELIKNTEAALEREIQKHIDKENPAQTRMEHLSELHHYRSRVAALEKENTELRKICEGNRTPKYLPIVSPHNPRRDLGTANTQHNQSFSPHQQHQQPSQRQRALMSPRTIYNDSSLDDSSPEEFLASPPALKQLDLQDQHRQQQQQLNQSRSSTRSLKKIFGKIKRSNSGGQLNESVDDSNLNTSSNNQVTSATPEFRRGGFRATTGSSRMASTSASRLQQKSATPMISPQHLRLERSNSANFIRKPISEWNVDAICTWLEYMGLGGYCGEVQKTVGTGADLAKMGFHDLESKLGVKNAMHKKKLYLALSARQDPNRPDPEGGLDHQWVLRWLDDVGLPQYKDTFLDARVDGRVLNVLTVDELVNSLKVSNLLHHLSLKRGIFALRKRAFDPDCLKRRALPGESVDPLEDVAYWSNHRVMEWLRQADLSEYAPNLRGSGVHGALLIYEIKFNDELMATLLSIPAAKTLLRRHLRLHFKDLVGKDIIAAKRSAETAASYVPLNPSAKVKSQGKSSVGGSTFTLKRKKSKTFVDHEDLLCPFKHL